MCQIDQWICGERWRWGLYQLAMAAWQTLYTLEHKTKNIYYWVQVFGSADWFFWDLRWIRPRVSEVSSMLGQPSVDIDWLLSLIWGVGSWLSWSLIVLGQDNEDLSIWSLCMTVVEIWAGESNMWGLRPMPEMDTPLFCHVLLYKASPD